MNDATPSPRPFADSSEPVRSESDSLPLARLPVTVYLPVHRRLRGGRYWTDWWAVSIEKPRDFSAADFTPFVIQAECVETGALLRRYHLDLGSVDAEQRVVVCQPYGVAASKSWPFERALYALGWERRSAASLPAEVLGGAA